MPTSNRRATTCRNHKFSCAVFAETQAHVEAGDTARLQLAQQHTLRKLLSVRRTKSLPSSSKATIHWSTLRYCRLQVQLRTANRRAHLVDDHPAAEVVHARTRCWQDDSSGQRLCARTPRQGREKVCLEVVVSTLDRTRQPRAQSAGALFKSGPSMKLIDDDRR